MQIKQSNMNERDRLVEVEIPLKLREIERLRRDMTRNLGSTMKRAYYEAANLTLGRMIDRLAEFDRS